MKDHFRILKYLYENDNGNFLDVTKAFPEKKIPDRKRIEQIYHDLHDFIEIESIYNYRGIISPESKDIPETPIQKLELNKMEEIITSSKKINTFQLI